MPQHWLTRAIVQDALKASDMSLSDMTLPNTCGFNRLLSDGSGNSAYVGVQLLWLWNKFKSNRGKFIRKTLSHLDEAIAQTGGEAPAVLIHCSGLGARGLVQDKAMYPTRGQTVLVRAPWIKGDYTRKLTDNDSWYIIPRKSGDVILGGTREADDAWPYPRPETSDAIKKNCVKRESRALKNWCGFNGAHD